MFLLGVGTLAAAEIREFPRPCAEVFPGAVQTMMASKFELKTSDAAGGVLAMQYAGPSMVDTNTRGFYSRMAKPFFRKYVADGEKVSRGFLGLSYSRADFVFFGFQLVGNGVKELAL